MNWLIVAAIIFFMVGLIVLYLVRKPSGQYAIVNQKIIDEINAKAKSKAEEIKSSQTEIKTNEEVLDYLNNMSAK